MDRLIFGLDQADVGKLHGAWNYIGSNSVKKRMKFKKFLFHIYYIIPNEISSVLNWSNGKVLPASYDTI